MSSICNIYMQHNTGKKITYNYFVLYKINKPNFFTFFFKQLLTYANHYNFNPPTLHIQSSTMEIMQFSY